MVFICGDGEPRALGMLDREACKISAKVLFQARLSYLLQG